MESRLNTKSEYLFLTLTAVKLFWVCMIMKNLRIYLRTPPLIYRDNISVITLAFNPVYHTCTKHVEVDYHL